MFSYSKRLIWLLGNSLCAHGKCNDGGEVACEVVFATWLDTPSPLLGDVLEAGCSQAPARLLDSVVGPALTSEAKLSGE